MQQFHTTRLLQLSLLLLLTLTPTRKKQKILVANASELKSSAATPTLHKLLRSRPNADLVSSILQRNLAYAFSDSPTVTCTDGPGSYYPTWSKQKVKNEIGNAIKAILGGGFMANVLYATSGIERECG